MVEAARRGFIEYGFLGGARIDAYGNLNTTTIGDHDHPKVRLPGSGGGNDVGSHCWRTIAIGRHGKNLLAEVDFVTTPGFLAGPGAREAVGLPAGTGPYRVVTDLAILGYHPESRRMMVIAIQPGVTVEQVIENTGFDLTVAEPVDQAGPPPTPEELRLLRDEDPTAYASRHLTLAAAGGPSWPVPLGPRMAPARRPSRRQPRGLPG